MKQNPLNMMPNNGGRYYGFATKWDNLLLGMGRANVLHYNKENVLRIDYERYIDGEENYII